MEASFLEIYNENIRDLLVTPQEAKNLVYDIKMVEGKKSEVFVTNLKVKRNFLFFFYSLCVFISIFFYDSSLVLELSFKVNSQMYIS